MKPIENINRTAKRCVELGGQQIPEGDRLLLLSHSTNRDSERFADPVRFDIERKPNQHVSFGEYGRHKCLGAQLARLGIRVFFEALLKRMADLELTRPDIQLLQRRGNFMLGIEPLPVRFTSAARNRA